MKKIIAALALIIILLNIASCSKQQSVLRIGIIKPSIDHLPLSYALHTGLLDEASYKLISFSSGWELQEAIISRHVDIAIIPFTYAWNAAEKGHPIRIVSFFERETDGIITSNRINDLRELNRSKIGLLRASTLDVLMLDFAEKHGIEYESVYFRTPNEVVSALTSGNVDAIVLYVPLIQKLSSDYHVIHWFGSDHEAHPCCDIAVNTDNMNKDRLNLARKLLMILDESIEIVNNREEKVINYIQTTYGLSIEQAHQALDKTVYKTGLDEHGRRFERSMTDISVRLGYQTRQISNSDIYLDLDHDQF